MSAPADSATAGAGAGVGASGAGAGVGGSVGGGSDWAAQPEQLAEDIFRLPLPVLIQGLRAVNVYVLRGPEGADLIDAGDAHAISLDDLAAALGGVGVRVQDIRHVYVTHVHPDHYTLASVIRDAAGAEVYLGAGERPALEAMERLLRGEREPHIAADLDRLGAGELRSLLEPHRLRPPVRGDVWRRPDHWLAADAAVTTVTGELTALHTPGHTRGHVVYTDTARGLYFTGDHILPHITPSIGFESEPVPTALSDYLRSLRAVLELPDARLLPAHGPVRESAHARAAELLRHHDERLADTLGAVRTGGSTPFEVARQLAWTSRRKRFDDLTAWNRFLACAETSAHLETLAERGSVVRGTSARGGETFAPSGKPEEAGNVA
jgi:glyoxylase-like metal-dependent hydrolase (beta-lactamase superfamily II)